MKIAPFLQKRLVTQFGFKQRNGSSVPVTFLQQNCWCLNSFLYTTENFLRRNLMKPRIKKDYELNSLSFMGGKNFIKYPGL
jgi:hypothetical protein